MNEVSDSANCLRRQNLPYPGADTLYVLDRSGEFKHAVGLSRVRAATILARRTKYGSRIETPGARGQPTPRFRAETLARMRVSKQSVLVNLLQALLAIILGNIVYFLLLPSLPSVARHHPFHIDLGMVLDFWFCLVIYGAIRTARKWR